jgi:hypothetical protein
MGNERVLKLLVSTSVAGWIADQNWQKLVLSFTPFDASLSLSGAVF